MSMRLKTHPQAIMSIEQFKLQENLEELVDRFWNLKWISKTQQFQWFEPEFITHVKTMTDNPLLIVKWMRNALYEFSRIINHEINDNSISFIERIIRYEQRTNMKIKDLFKGYLGIGDLVEISQAMIKQSAKDDRGSYKK